MVTFTESVEALKREYTDKYVIVDPRRPELARFEHYVGQVKTVNMSGRALVEFIDYHLNIGWFDIDLSALQVVDKPTEESKAKAEAKRAAVPTAAKPAGAAAAGEKKLSPLEMARMQDKGKAGGGGPAAKPAGAKASTADILAAARGGAKPAAAAPAPAPKAETPKPAAATPKPAAGGIVRVDKSTMSVADMIAYCRAHDAA